MGLMKAYLQVTRSSSQLVRCVSVGLKISLLCYILEGCVETLSSATHRTLDIQQLKEEEKRTHSPFATTWA